MLQEEKIRREVDVSVAPWDKIGIMAIGAFDFFRDKRSVDTFDTVPWHEKRIEVGHDQAVVRHDALYVLEHLKRDCRRENVVRIRLFGASRR